MNENIKNIAEIIANKEDDNDTVIILAKLKLDFSEAIPFATALDKAGYRKQSETVNEFAEKLKEKIEFREQELIISCKQIEETDMLECDLFRTAREYGLYNIIDQLAKEYGVEVEKC